MVPSLLCSSFFGAERYSSGYWKSKLDTSLATESSTYNLSCLQDVEAMVLQNFSEWPSNFSFILRPIPWTGSKALYSWMVRNWRRCGPETYGRIDIELAKWNVREMLTSEILLYTWIGGLSSCHHQGCSLQQPDITQSNMEIAIKSLPSNLKKPSGKSNGKIVKVRRLGRHQGNMAQWVN